MKQVILIVLGIAVSLIPRTTSGVALNVNSSETLVLEDIPDAISLNDSNRFIDAKSVFIINCSFAQTLPDNALDTFLNLQNLTIVASNLSEVKKWTQHENKKIVRIDLHGNRIWQIAFASFASYTKLVELNLSHNRIIRINNETFYGANQLEWIDLSGNLLEQIDEFTFTELLRLKSLNLRQNKIQYLDVFSLTTTTQLQHLDLSENKLKIVDNLLLFNLLHLKCLNLSGNALRIIATETFAENKELIELDLSRNRIVDLYDDALIGLQSLEFLNLKQNMISAWSSSLFKDLNALKCLDISSNLLASLSDAQFFHLQSLQWLYLSSNVIQKISNHSFTGLPNLELVDLSLNRLNDSNFLHNMSTLKMLNFSFNRFEAIDVTLLNGIDYVELVGNYWRCSWLIPELVNRRLSTGINFLANSTSRKSVYDEIDCYSDADDIESPRNTVLPKHHSLRHIVVLRENLASNQCDGNKNSEQTFVSRTINIYQRSFTKLVSDNFTFTNSLIWIGVGMILLIILVHLGKYLASDWNKVIDADANSQHDVEERFLKATEQSKGRSLMLIR